MEPMPGLSQAEIDSMINNAAAAAATAALAALAASAAEAARIAAFTAADITGTGPGLGMLGSGAGLGTAAGELGRFGSAGGPGQRGGGTTVIINATAVTGQEVVDAMGAYVDTNGPLPPHWQQSAN